MLFLDDSTVGGETITSLGTDYPVTWYRIQIKRKPPKIPDLRNYRFVKIWVN